MKGNTKVDRTRGECGGIRLVEGGPVTDGARSAPSRAEVMAAIEELVQSFKASLRFRSLAKDEMIAIAWLEAQAALDRFDPARGVPLKAFLYRRVRGALIKSLAELHGGGLRPRNGATTALSCAMEGTIPAEADPALNPEQQALSSLVEQAVRRDLAAYLIECADSGGKRHAGHAALFVRIALGIETRAEAAERLGVGVGRVGRIYRNVRDELRERPALRDAIDRLAGR